eukprot:TRINITY_DN8886_c1_g1_i2.p1 TRINITY_DN8886_c1_g1~~TRINITY_DN8886_c1_g1_i2.p1  ORF type:complete len:105 (+),score=8.24 TRINITY_DN8886_c1_g1_i2:483-797(+)
MGSRLPPLNQTQFHSPQNRPMLQILQLLDHSSLRHFYICKISDPPQPEHLPPLNPFGFGAIITILPDFTLLANLLSEPLSRTLPSQGGTMVMARHSFVKTRLSP